MKKLLDGGLPRSLTRTRKTSKPKNKEIFVKRSPERKISYAMQ